ncbi:MAG TPA: O-antigen ligase family protein [Terriglobales bacterium]
MMRRYLFVAMGITASAIAVLLLLSRGQGYLTDPGILAILTAIEFILAAVWSFRSRFFLVLMAAFMWAGIGLPFAAAWTSGRWFVLVAGVSAGCLAYLKESQLHLAAFHFAAFMCAATAIVSANISDFPQAALLKALSLSLLFLYGLTGARLAALGREKQFLSSLVIACEGLIYACGVAYFGFHYRLLGNPNSLGAIMGVVAVPLFLWEILSSEHRNRRLRFTIAMMVALLLLFGSYARAGIVAAIFSSLLLCIAAGRYRALIKGACLALLLAVTAATLTPRPETSDLTSTFLYKGKREQGLLGSRRSVWDNTVAVIEAHPWLGVGFGTSKTSDEEIQPSEFAFHSEQPITREHGNSYLAITEWVGLLGDLPFLFLLSLIVVNAARIFIALRRSGKVIAPAVPIATIMVAGLVHAAFEDWLFAVGYYLCVFFWSLAFILADLAPWPSPLPVPPFAPPDCAPNFSSAHHAPVS